MIQTSKKEMIDELKEKLNNWNEYSEKIYGYSKEDALDFLKRFQIGVYDCGLNGVLWFGPKVNIDLLVAWDADRRKNKRAFSNISEENLIVYSVILEIKLHLLKIELFPQAYKTNYISPINRTIQTPTTKTELNEYIDLLNTVLTTNYTWREAREIRSYFKQFNIYENSDFPHHPETLIKCFKPEVIKFFPDFFPGKCSFETTPIKEIAQRLLKDYSEKNIIKYLSSENKTHYDKYLIRQIFSIIDFNKIFSNESKEYITLKEQLSNQAALSMESIHIIFNESTKKEILNLIKELLISVTTSKKIINIQKSCHEFNNNLHCTRTHKLVLPDSTIIKPLNTEKHEKEFIRFQKKYEYLYKNATDLEYVEGCIEILGDFLKTQMFSIGNKETAICLFNSLLISRGILPPVVDLNEKDYSLLMIFAKDLNNRYQEAIPLILKETVEQTKQFENNTYCKTISLN